MEEEDRGTSTTPKKSSVSPSLRSKKVWGRVPPPEQIWKESLRSDQDQSSCTPLQIQKDSEQDLTALVTSTMAELQGTRKSPSQRNMIQRLSNEGKKTYFFDTESSKRKFVEKVVKRALNLDPEGDKDSVLRKSEGSAPWTSPKFELETNQRHIETEASHSPILSPQISDRYRSGPQSENKPSQHTVKRLKDELRISQDKYRKLEEMYALLLNRKSGGAGYKKKYEDLKSRYSKDQSQLISKTEECTRLTSQLSHISSPTTSPPILDLSCFAKLQQDMEELKARVTRTEQENHAIRAKTAV